MRAFPLFSGNLEPSIDEMLDDPIVGLVMKRDRVTADEVRSLIDTARRRRRNSRSDLPQARCLCEVGEV